MFTLAPAKRVTGLKFGFASHNTPRRKTTTTMLPVESIIRTAVRETDGKGPSDLAAYISQVQQALADPDQIPTFSDSARPLSVVRFRCLLQDTGYPAEVYLPAEDQGAAGNGPAGAPEVDWGRLQERWVGWAVNIPGEQAWAHLGRAEGQLGSELAALSLDDAVGMPLPPVIKGKYPLKEEGDSYTGALLKVYDEDAAFSPASAYDVVGIVSAAPVPLSDEADDEDADLPLVPAIHVLQAPTPTYPAPVAPPADSEATRAALLAYLASAFSPPDETAAELLLLALLASPASRPSGVPPLGTLTLNLLRPTVDAPLLPAVLATLVPAVLPLRLTLPLLHEVPFLPASSDGTSLTPGLLQLAPGTLLLVDEDGLGAGGALREPAVRNLQALAAALERQTVSYQYPFTDGVRIDTALRGVLGSEGKSLLPADVRLPVALASAPAAALSPSPAQLAAFRAYLAFHGSAAHAARLEIPDAVGTAVQESFVAERKAAGAGSAEAAQARLERRMKIARIAALSYPAATLTLTLWDRTVALDSEADRRLAAREARQRESPLGAPSAVAAAANGISANGAAANSNSAGGARANGIVAPHGTHPAPDGDFEIDLE